ncbi:hypothetical protein COOONC_27097 [Cooperia oncophora]
MLFAIAGLCFLLANVLGDYSSPTLDKCLTYKANNNWYKEFHLYYNRNLEWDDELSNDACNELVTGVEYGAYARYKSEKSFDDNSVSVDKVRATFFAGLKQDRSKVEMVKSFKAGRKYGCNGKFDGNDLTVLCLYEP